jgi:hypothetical protein
MPSNKRFSRRFMVVNHLVEELILNYYRRDEGRIVESLLMKGISPTDLREALQTLNGIIERREPRGAVSSDLVRRHQDMVRRNITARGEM